MRRFSLIAGIPATLLLALGLASWAIGPEEGPKRSPAGPHRGVRDFGAVGDGKADDTDAIQRAIDEGDGQVRLPTGVYRLTRPLRIDLDRVGFTAIDGGGTARLLMEGAGPALRFVGTHEGSAAPNEFKPEGWDRQRAPQANAPEIVGNHAEACGIEADGTMQLTLTRVLIRHTRHAIRLARRNRNVLIADCHLYENRGIGIFYDDVN